MRNKYITLCIVLRNLAHLLYAAASECSYVDPHKVEGILKVPVTASERSERMHH